MKREPMDVETLRRPAPPGLARFERVTLEGVDFRRATFERFVASGCLFVACDFRGTRLERKHQSLFSGPRQSVFRECRFEEADLREVQPGQARFEGCHFDAALLDGWSSECAEFVDCRFAGRLARVKFYGRPWGPAAQALEPARAVNAFRGNDFRETELREVLFVMGIDIDVQRWPEAGPYVRLDRVHQRLTRTHAVVMRWSELDARKNALDFLRDISFVFAQQRGIFARKGDLRRDMDPALEERVWEALVRALD